MSEIKEKIMKSYGPKNIILEGSWKTDSDKFFGPKEAVEVWRMLKNSGLVPGENEDIVFVSPTANTPTHETAIWQEENKTRSGSSTFLVGDLLPIDPKSVIEAANIPDDTQNKFTYFHWDAEALPIQNNSVDVIWDRKGWVWHAVYNFQDSERLDKAFKDYHELLKPGGIIVLDANPSYTDYLRSLSRKDKLNMAMNRLFIKSGLRAKAKPSEFYTGSPQGQYEDSTVGMINKNYPLFWITASNIFGISDYGSGTLAHRVFVKK